MTPTGQATQNIKVTSDNLTRKSGKSNSAEDNLASLGFEALFANAMVAGQAERNTLGLQQALQNVSNKTNPVVEPPASFAAMNGVAGAVQAAVSNRSETNNPVTSQGTAVAQSPGTPASETPKAASANKPASATTTNAERPSSPEQSKTTQTNSSTDTASDAAAKDNKNTQSTQAKTDTPAVNVTKEVGIEQKIDPKIAEAIKQAVKTDTVDIQTKPNIVAAAATDKSTSIDTANLKTDNTEADVDINSNTELNSKQSPSDRNVRTEAHELAASRGAEKPDLKGQFNNRADAAAQNSNKLDINSQAVAAQVLQTNGRQIQSGDSKLVTNGIDAKGAVNGQVLPGLAAQPGLRTGSAAEAEIKAPVNQPGFAKELGQKITWALGKNMSTVDIRLNPEQMGTLNLRIVQQGQNIQLIIRTSDETSGALLQQAISGLRETMSQNGLQLNQVQIHSGNNPNSNQSQFGQNLQGQQQQSGSGSQSGQGNQNQQHASQHESEHSATNASENRRTDGNLDLFA